MSETTSLQLFDTQGCEGNNGMMREAMRPATLEEMRKKARLAVAELEKSAQGDCRLILHRTDITLHWPW